MSLFTDVRYALRAVRSRPGFFLLALATLAAGIGSAACLFSFVVAWIIEPLSFPASDRLTYFRSLQTREGRKIGISAGDFRDWRESARGSFESMSRFAQVSHTLLSSSDAPERIVSAQVSPSFLRTLGVAPAMGRDFLPNEETHGAHRVVLVSHGFWKTRLNGAADVLGSILKLDNEDYTIIGVMPEKFHFPLLGRTNLWTPLAPTAEELARRGDRSWRVVGRLKPGATVGQAQQELSAVASRLAAQYPETNGEIGAFVEPLTVEIGRNTGDQIILALFLITVGLLLIACSNVANLLLIRALGRQRQSAIQMSLGAGRTRLVIQALTETFLIFTLAAGLGALLGMWMTDWCCNLIDYENRGYLPNYGTVPFDWRVLAASLGASLIMGLIFGLAPAFESVRVDISRMLKESGSAVSAGRGRGRLRGALVVAQVLLATVVVCSTGVLVSAARSIMSQELGFDPKGLLTFEMLIDEKKYATREQRLQFYETIEASLRSVPQAGEVAVTQFLPFGPNLGRTRFWIDGQADIDRRRAPAAAMNFVTPSYLGTMRIPLLSGRGFSEKDRDGPPVVVINEVLARQQFSGKNPIGRRLAVTRLKNQAAEIVGVVKEISEGFGAKHEPQIYAHFSQSATTEAMVVMRPAADPLSLVPTVRKTISQADRFQPIFRVKTQDERIHEQFAPYRTMSTMLIAFGLLALALASVGVYGVIAFSVSQRVREMGIRAALGADRAILMRLIMGQGVWLLILGLIPGLAVSMALSRILHSVLEDPRGQGGSVFIVTAVVLALAAAIATLIPARRAARIDPLEALRHE